MKKILLFASALAGLFLAGSCQRENLEPQQTEQQVTFTIEAPAALQTKAIADGLNVDELIYEVWITETPNAETLDGATRLYQAKTDMQYDETNKRMKANVTLDLVNDQNFTVLFWAQKKNIGVYNTDWLNAVTYTDLKENAYAANDARLDAFYSKAYVVDCQTATPTVVLRRPFAQVNLCTLNKKDAAQVAGNYNISLVSSEMRLDAVPTVFNVATSEATNYVAMDFAANTVPSGDDETITVNGQEYFYAGMNYVFAGANIVLTYDIQTLLNGTVDANVNNTIQNVPLKENHRTNIVGNLLTSKTDFEIIVDADFNAPENVIGEEWTQTGDYTYAIKEGASAAALKEVLAHANAEAALAATKSEGPVVTIDLAADVEWETGAGIGSTPLLPDDSPISAVVINGNGKTFTATGKGVGQIRLANGALLTFNNVKVVDHSVSYAENAWEYGYLEFGGNLEFNDCQFVNAIMMESENAAFANCSFNSNHDNEYAVWVNEGNTTFNGCTFTGARGLKVHEAYGSEVVSVVVDGCTFGPLTKKPGIALGDLNADTSVTIKNSLFLGCQPGDQNLYMYETDTDVTTFDFKNENNEVYNNTNDMIAGRIENAQAGETVNIPAGEYTFPTDAFKAGVTLNCAEGTVFTGNSKLNINGATVIGATFSNPSGSAVDQTINGTFKNCTFTGKNAVRYAYAGETCYFENCVFSGNTYGFHFDGGANEAYFKNCTFSGFNAFGAAVELVTFDGCTFKGNGKSGYNGANLWGSAKMINTEFIFDGSTTNEWIDCIGADKTYEFTGCTVNGGSAVNPDYIWSRTVGAKIKIDGVTYTWAEGGYLLAENGDAVVTDADAFAAALAKDATKKIALMPGTYEGVFKIQKDVEIISESAENKATIKGRVDIDSYGDGASFKNVKFEINNDSKVKNVFTGANYKYPSTVNIYGAAVAFDGCDFITDIATGVCGINYGAHAPNKMLTVNDCTFTGDFYAIRSRTLFSITNSEFDIHTDQGILAAVFTWGNGQAGTQGDSGANSVTFIGNTNLNANQTRGVQLSSTTFNYCHINFNVQGNTNFVNFEDSVNPACDFTGCTFADGSDKF